jgi:hypothetical protein
MDLRMLSYSFVILEEQGTPCTFAIDDIYWSAGVSTAVGDTPDRYTPGVLQTNAPNPFNARTNLRFELADGGPYTVRVYDVTGRVVRTFSGVGVSGENVIQWHGRDDRGDEVASGVYYYQLQVGSFTQTRKMALVK